MSIADIAASGLSAERMRMDIAAENIASAHATRTSEGGPYRRRAVVFETVLQDQLHPETGGGVRVAGVQVDDSPLPRIHQPGHPDADADGFVTFPNVQLPREMVDLLTASRAYEANLRSLQTYQKMSEQTLSLLRGLR